MSEGPQPAVGTPVDAFSSWTLNEQCIFNQAGNFFAMTHRFIVLNFSGAMENKSLNIFNSRLVLATPNTATDGDFARIEGGQLGRAAQGHL